MGFLAAILAVFAAALAVISSRLAAGLRAAKAELDASRRNLVAPAPPPLPSVSRQFERRLERHGLLWFPVLTAADAEKLVVGVSSGVPHCVRCVRPLKLVPGRREAWDCPGCGERHPGMAADLAAMDEVLADCLREFLSRHPDFTLAPGLSAPKLAPAAV